MWSYERWKVAHRCGAKHIWKSKCTKHSNVGPAVARRTFPSQNAESTTFRALWEVEMFKKCTPLWRQAHFRSQNVQSTPRSDRFWKLRCRKSARRCGAKHQVKSARNWRVRSTFGCSDVVPRGRRKGLCTTLSKASKTWGFSSIFQNDGRRGTFEEDLQRCIFRGRRSTRDMFIRDIRRLGRWFPEGGCILQHQIFSFGKMILCDRCSTSYALASHCRGSRNTSETWIGKIATCIGTRPSSSALNFPLFKGVWNSFRIFFLSRFGIFLISWLVPFA